MQVCTTFPTKQDLLPTVDQKHRIEVAQEFKVQEMYHSLYIFPII